MSVIHGVNYGTPTLDLNFAKNKSLIDTVSGLNLVTFSRSSTATYVGADGLIKTAVANEARFDHNPLTGECLGLLIEESRTNEMSQSVIRPDNAGIYSRWTGFDGASIIPDAELAPDGTFTAALITFPQSVNVPSVRRQTTIASGARTVSVWIKAKSGTIQVRVGNGADFGAGQTVGTQWTRVTYTVAGGSSNFAGIYCPTSLVFTEFYAWGFQQEPGSFPTSYIPTTTATVTRAADIMSITGTNFSRWYNQSEGTFLAKGRQTYTTPNQFESLIAVGGFPNRSWSWAIIGGGNSWSVGTDGLDTGSFYTGLTPNVPFSFNVAQAQKSNQSVAVADGVIKASVTPGQILYTNASGLSIGSNYDGTIARLTYYPTRLQDFQLRQLTK